MKTNDSWENKIRKIVHDWYDNKFNEEIFITNLISVIHELLKSEKEKRIEKMTVSNKNWVKEFDKKFQSSLMPLIPMIPNKRIDLEIKSFIQSLLDRQLSEIRKEFVTDLHQLRGEIPLTWGLSARKTAVRMIKKWEGRNEI